MTRTWGVLRPDWLILPSVVAWALALPPWGVAPLAFCGLVPWLLALNRAPSPWRAFFLGLWLSLGLGAATLYPVVRAFADYQDISWLGAGAVALVTALVFQLPLPLFAMLRGWLGARLSSSALLLAWLSAALFTGLDWLVPKPFGDTLGLVFYQQSWWRQLADLGGPLVLTFVAMLCNETLVALITGVRRSSWRTALVEHRRLAVSTVGVMLVCFVYGGWRSAQWSAAARAAPRHLDVGIVQANLPLGVKRAAEKGDNRAADRTLSAYLQLSEQLTADPSGSPDLIVWPETTYPGLFRQPFNRQQAQRNVALDLWVQRRQQAIVFGSYDGEPARGGGLRQFNALFAVSPAAGGQHQPAIPDAKVYRKRMLVPFGETVPLVGERPTVRRLFPHVSFFGRGPGPRVVPVQMSNGERVKIGPTVCYEDFFSHYSLTEAQLGAEVLVNVSNDGWFGPYLVREFHLAHAVFRSVETRLPQVRAASSGFSAIIAPSGEVIQRSEPLARMTLRGLVPLGFAPDSPVRRLGLVFGPAALVLAAVGIARLAWPWR